MPKTKLQNVIFTIIMAFVMVYAMVCYNIAIDKGWYEQPDFLTRISRDADYVADCSYFRIFRS